MTAAFWWLGGGVSLFLVLAIMGGVLLVRALRGGAERQPAQYEPDVAVLGAAAARGKAAEGGGASSAGDPAVPASPTSGAVGSQGKGRPFGTGRPKPSAGPAERF